MKFYQENKINPLAGCLPLIVQMPVLFALFRVLRDDPGPHPDDRPVQRPVPRPLRQRERPPRRARIPKGMYFLGMNLMVSPANSGSVTDNFIERLPYFIAVACVVASGWYQMWQTQLRQKKLGHEPEQPDQQADADDHAGSSRSSSAGSPASRRPGLVLYFVTSSLWRIGQQHLVLNKYYEEHATGSEGACRRRTRSGRRSRSGRGDAKNGAASRTSPRHRRCRSGDERRRRRGNGAGPKRSRRRTRPARSGSAGAEPMEWIEVTAKSLDEAVELALDRLGRRRRRARVRGHRRAPQRAVRRSAGPTPGSGPG